MSNGTVTIIIMIKVMLWIFVLSSLVWNVTLKFNLFNSLLVSRGQPLPVVVGKGLGTHAYWSCRTGI